MASHSSYRIEQSRPIHTDKQGGIITQLSDLVAEGHTVQEKHLCGAALCPCHRF